MEDITKYNFEAFYLDYLEGNLNEPDTVRLFAFLEANPDCKAEVEGEDDILEFNLDPTSDEVKYKEEFKYFDCLDEEICLNNYDKWLIAEMHGELDPQQINDLTNFIKDNKLENEHKAMSAAVLKPNPEEIFRNHSILKKEDSEVILLNTLTINNYEDWFVADLEGELNPKQKDVLNGFVKANKLQSEHKVMMLTVLEPNLAEVFSDKSALNKRETKIISIMFRVAAIAAIFTLLFNVINWNNDTLVSYEPQPNHLELILPEDSSNIEFIFDRPEKISPSRTETSPFKKKKVIEIQNSFPETVIQPGNLVAEHFEEKPIKANDSISLKNGGQEKELQPIPFIENPDDIVPPNDDLAVVESLPVNSSQSSVKLNDKYRPVTRTINNYTGLDITYKQTDASSNVAMTQFKVGLFSFERKKNR